MHHPPVHTAPSDPVCTATGRSDPTLVCEVLIPPRIEGAPPPWGQPCHTLSGQGLGTTWSARCHARPGLPLTRLRQALQDELDRVDEEMSTWRADSHLGRFNRAAPGSRHRLPAGFAQVMDAALCVARASGGAFDPCAGALVERWGFGPGPDTRTAAYQAPGFRSPGPDTPALTGALQGAPAWDTLIWDRREGHLTQPGGVQLDLCAIAKGHAVDRLSACLLTHGCPDHLVEVGGELRGEGLKPDGQPWWVDLEPPETHLTPTRHPWAATRLALHGLAVATSGDYRRAYLDARGQRRSHTLDPRSSQPIAHGVASVTVVHREALWADGWSTALLVLGPEDGLNLARREGLAARWLQRPTRRGSNWRCVESPVWQDLKQ